MDDEPEFTSEAPLVDPEGNKLWLDDFGDEGVFLFAQDGDQVVRVDVNSIECLLLADRLGAGRR